MGFYYAAFDHGERRDEGVEKKKQLLLIVNDCGSNERQSNERASNVLLLHENEGKGNESIFVPPRSIVPRWFHYEVEKSLIISLLNGSVSKCIGGFNNNNREYIVF